MNICPVTCKIVKEAIKAHDERGVIMAEYIDYYKACNAYCLMCTRNEKSSDLPPHLRMDNWKEGKE